MTKENEIATNLSMIEYYKEQLASIDMQIQYLQAAVADYHKAKITVEQLNKTKGADDILVPVGLGVFINASTKDTSKVLVDIGAGIVAEKTVDDAIKKIDGRIEALQENQKKLLSMAQQLQTEAVELSNKTQKLVDETRE